MGTLSPLEDLSQCSLLPMMMGLRFLRMLLMVFLQTKKPLLQSSSVMSYLEHFSPKESHGELTQLLGVTPSPPRCSRLGSLRLCPMRTTRGQLPEWWTPTSLQQMELFMLLIPLYNSF